MGEFSGVSVEIKYQRNCECAFAFMDEFYGGLAPFWHRIVYICRK